MTNTTTALDQKSSLTGRLKALDERLKYVARNEPGLCSIILDELGDYRPMLRTLVYLSEQDDPAAAITSIVDSIEGRLDVIEKAQLSSQDGAV